MSSKWIADQSDISYLALLNRNYALPTTMQLCIFRSYGRYVNGWSGPTLNF